LKIGRGATVSCSAIEKPELLRAKVWSGAALPAAGCRQLIGVCFISQKHISWGGQR